MSEQDRGGRITASEDSDGHDAPWEDKLDAGLKWLSDVAWPLGGSVLVTSVIYLHSYIMVEKVPISILSSGFATALPSLFVMLLVVVSLLCGSVLLPISVLFAPVTERGERLIDQTVWGNGGKSNQGTHRRLVGCWLIGLTFSAVILWGSAWGVSSLGISSEIGNGIMLAAFILAAGVFWVLVAAGHVPRLRWKAASSTFRRGLAMSACVQQIIMLNVLILVGHVASGAGQYPVLRFLVYMAGVVFAVAVTQLLGATGVQVVRKHRNPVKQVTLCSLAGIVLAGVFPSTGAMLASYPIQVTASGGHPCAVFTWTPNASAATQYLSEQAAARYSGNLRILALADGTFFVRPWKTDSKAVFFVPVASVAKLDECPSTRT